MDLTAQVTNFSRCVRGLGRGDGPNFMPINPQNIVRKLSIVIVAHCGNCSTQFCSNCVALTSINRA